MEALSQTAVKVDPNPIKAEPITTGKTEAGYLSFPFTVDAEGCTVRFGLEQTYYHLAATLPQYNALFSLLLACWVNQYKVSFTYRLAVRGSLVSVDPKEPNTPIILNMVSVHATPIKP